MRAGATRLTLALDDTPLACRPHVQGQAHPSWPTPGPATSSARVFVVLGLLVTHKAWGTIALLVRPIYHRTPDRVRAHILLCLLAFYVEWHLRRAWEPLLFEDEELAGDRPRRDPVRPARPSESARLKKKTHATPEGLPVHSLRSLLAHLGTRCRNTCVVTGDPNKTTFRQVTEADALQAEALRLVKM